MSDVPSYLCNEIPGAAPGKKFDPALVDFAKLRSIGALLWPASDAAVAAAASLAQHAQLAGANGASLSQTMFAGIFASVANLGSGGEVAIYRPAAASNSGSVFKDFSALESYLSNTEAPIVFSDGTGTSDGAAHVPAKAGGAKWDLGPSATYVSTRFDESAISQKLIWDAGATLKHFPYQVQDVSFRADHTLATYTATANSQALTMNARGSLFLPTGTAPLFVVDAGAFTSLTLNLYAWGESFFFAHTIGGASNAQSRCVARLYDGASSTVVNAGAFQDFTGTQLLFQVFGASQVDSTYYPNLSLQGGTPYTVTGLAGDPSTVGIVGARVGSLVVDPTNAKLWMWTGGGGWKSVALA